MNFPGLGRQLPSTPVKSDAGQLPSFTVTNFTPLSVVSIEDASTTLSANAALGIPKAVADTTAEAKLEDNTFRRSKIGCILIFIEIVPAVFVSCGRT